MQVIHPQPLPILRMNGQLPPQPPSTHLALGQLPSQPAPTEQADTHHQPLPIQCERPAAIISRRKSGRQSIHRHRKNIPSNLYARPAAIPAIATERAGTFNQPSPIQSQTASCHHQPPPSKERAGNPFTATTISPIIQPPRTASYHRSHRGPANDNPPSSSSSGQPIYPARARQLHRTSFNAGTRPNTNSKTTKPPISSTICYWE